MAARVLQHRALARHRREYAQTEKAEHRFGEYCPGHADGGLDKDRLKNIGKQVAQHDPEIGSSHRANSQDEGKLLHFQVLGARRPDSRFALRVKAALGRGWGRLLPLMPVTQSREQKDGRHAGQSASDKENAVGVNEAVRGAQPFDRSAGKSL